MTSVKEGLAKGTANIINEKGQMILLLKEELQKQAFYIKELKAALRPFADKAETIQSHVDDGLFWPVNASVGDLRTARKVLENGDDNS